MSDRDELIDQIRYLERELYSPRDGQGRLKIGTKITWNKPGVGEGVITFVGDIEESRTNRQPYLVSFPDLWMRSHKDGNPRVQNTWWADETQFKVVEDG